MQELRTGATTKAYKQSRKEDKDIHERKKSNRKQNIERHEILQSQNEVREFYPK